MPIWADRRAGPLHKNVRLTSGMAPANQLRLSFTGSEDGEAETETCRAAKPWWRKTNRTSGPRGLNLTKPPYADPHVRCCGRVEWATTPPMPISSPFRPAGSNCIQDDNRRLSKHGPSRLQRALSLAPATTVTLFGRRGRVASAHRLKESRTWRPQHRELLNGH